jgi:hypothetical protein
MVGADPGDGGRVSPAMSQTDSEALPPAPAGEAETRTPHARPGFGRRVVDWYLARPEWAAARRAASFSVRELDLLGRAKAALATGNLVREPSDPSRKKIASAHAAALYSEALFWAFWSYKPDVSGPTAEALWTDDSELAREFGFTTERAAEVKKLFSTPQLGVLLAERTESEQEAAAAALKRAAVVAIDVRERPLRALEAITLKALARIVLTVLLIAGAAGAAVALRPQRPNIAAGKRWSASSSLFDCHPDQGECGGAKTRIFFHTKDETDPWLQYDLGSKTEISALRIENRQDAEGARAVPLIVEVSDDGSRFKEVARRDEDFSVWKPSFPKVSTRYVRLRVPRKSMLHLDEVEIYR